MYSWKCYGQQMLRSEPAKVCPKFLGFSLALSSPDFGRQQKQTTSKVGSNNRYLTVNPCALNTNVHSSLSYDVTNQWMLSAKATTYGSYLWSTNTPTNWLADLTVQWLDLHKKSSENRISQLLHTLNLAYKSKKTNAEYPNVPASVLPIRLSIYVLMKHSMQYTAMLITKLL